MFYLGALESREKSNILYNQLKLRMKNGRGSGFGEVVLTSTLDVVSVVW